MGSSLRKNKSKTEFMSEPRNFGLPVGQVIHRDPLSPDLYMKIGTRVGTITAYYQHVSPVNLPKPSVSQSTPLTAPAVKLPAVRFIPPLEQTVPIPEQPVYDIPKKSL